MALGQTENLFVVFRSQGVVSCQTLPHSFLDPLSAWPSVCFISIVLLRMDPAYMYIDVCPWMRNEK